MAPVAFFVCAVALKISGAPVVGPATCAPIHAGTPSSRAAVRIVAVRTPSPPWTYLLLFHWLIDSGAPASSLVVSVSTSPLTSQCRGLLVASGPPPVFREDR